VHDCSDDGWEEPCKPEDIRTKRIDHTTFHGKKASYSERHILFPLYIYSTVRQTGSLLRKPRKRQFGLIDKSEARITSQL
jgi:hypothetical protein